MDKTEKLLKSIDNTLKDVWKELKRQGRPKEMTSVTTHETPTSKDRKEELIKLPIVSIEKDEFGQCVACVSDSEYRIPITSEEFERLRKILGTGESMFLYPEVVINNITSQDEEDLDVKSECCKESPDAIKWNPYNKVVQCHRCGRIYLPKKYGEISERK